MPSTPHRTKKALQEIARVFNKLASELTADLNQAVRDIENLRREVQRLKTNPGKTSRPSSNTRRKTGNRTGRSPKTGTLSHTSSGHPGRSEPHRETLKPTNEASSFVFPREPFNPPSPPDPSPSGNN